MLLLVAVTGCEDPVDPGQVAREDRPPEAEPPPPLVLETQKPAPAPRLRETRSLGHAGDQPLTQVAPRPSMFAQERAGQPRMGQPYYYYGGYPQGRGRASAPPPAQPVGTSNLIWSSPSAPSGVGGAGLGGATGYGSPAGSPLGPR